MVNFAQLRKDVQQYDEERENLIKKSRDVLKLSKQLIYSVHRSEMTEAGKLFKEIEKQKKELDVIAMHNAKMVYEGSYKVAIQEYVEAVLYYEFVKSGKLPDLDVLGEHYILGLCDLPGELTRRAVFLAGKGDVQSVLKIKDQVDVFYGELLKFDFRDNEVRRKVDAVKYELKKLEDLVLDLKLRGKVRMGKEE
ncbi:TPA: hypothetical protein HA241_01825 [Candidatus Woesearchaeota archaeon]|nr:hypothetical protein [Candidatus Woesearchaeota archaeon]